MLDISADPEAFAADEVFVQNCSCLRPKQQHEDHVPFPVLMPVQHQVGEHCLQDARYQEVPTPYSLNSGCFSCKCQMPTQT